MCGIIFRSFPEILSPSRLPLSHLLLVPCLLIADFNVCHTMCAVRKIYYKQNVFPHKSSFFSLENIQSKFCFFFLCYKRLKRFSVLLLFLYLSSYLFKLCRGASQIWFGTKVFVGLFYILLFLKGEFSTSHSSSKVTWIHNNQKHLKCTIHLTT